MVFYTRDKSVKYLSLLINGKLIERVTQFNFLGLTLESSMSRNLHINHILLKISKAIGILYRLKTIYPQLVLQTLYNTLIQPYFNYCLLA